MTVTKKITTLALTLVMLMCLIPSTVFAAGKSGWYQEGDDWYYYQADMMLARTWLKWQSNWYYFADDGRMANNTAVYIDFEKKTYVFDKGGALTKKTGWVSKNSLWYYVKKGGVCTTGWKQVGKKWYYFAPKGTMISERWAKDDANRWYYLGKDGAMVTNTWVYDKEEEEWCYQDKYGRSVLGWLKLGKKWYYMDGEFGFCLMNTSKEIDGKTYKFDKDGVCLNP